jgi:two-component sensor histidine kinase
MFSTDNIFYIMNAASFPIPGNTVIRGKVEKADSKSISILGKYNFNLKPDGTFYCPILLTRPALVDITLDNDWHRTFLEPGDTLDILISKGNVSNIPSIDSNSIKTILYYNNKIINYGGTAAFNTMLMKEGYSHIELQQKDFGDLETYFASRKVKTKQMEETLKKFEGKASKVCVDFVRTEFNYYLAHTKYRFLDNQRYLKIPDNQKLKFIADYPSGFFMEYDTMSVLVNNFEWGWYYKWFLGSANSFKNARLTMSIGQITSNIDISLLKASLRGYPLYSGIFDYLNDAFKRGYASVKKNETDYFDFIHNCNDPTMVDSIKKVYQIANLTAPGKLFPVKSLTLQDSSNFNIYSHKGKPVCLIFSHSLRREKILAYRKELQKFKSDEVTFVFFVAQSGENDSLLQSVKSMPNVKINYFDCQTMNNIMFYTGNDKVIMLDKWYRIFDDNIPDPYSNTGSNAFEQIIREAINAKHYSKEHKASFYKTAGWSLGSILITVFIGLLVYRRRVQRIKEQEAIKRQIKELEIKAIRSQMNPHFIFNALNSIQSLINSNHFKEANIYLAKFAVLLRRVLHNSEKSMVSLSDELEALELYCQLEQLRFEFELIIDVDEHINCNLIEIPGMMIQPLAENAIVHGLSPKGDHGILNIAIIQENNNLHIRVLDNGVGLPPQDNDSLRQKGFGLKLVEERLKIIKHDGKSASLTVVNNSTGNSVAGTLAELIIPID